MKGNQAYRFFVIFIFFFPLLTQAKVSTSDVIHMLNQMVRENVISQKESEKIKLNLKNFSPKQWKRINENGVQFLKRMPASYSLPENKMTKVNKSDLENQQLHQIENQMKMMIPEMSH